MSLAGFSGSFCPCNEMNGVLGHDFALVRLYWAETTCEFCPCYCCAAVCTLVGCTGRLEKVGEGVGIL